MNLYELGIRTSELKIGDKVYYQPDHYPQDKWENGLVKEIPSTTNTSVRVVYNCAGNWAEFKNYTSALTHIRDLKLKQMNNATKFWLSILLLVVIIPSLINDCMFMFTTIALITITVIYCIISLIFYDYEEDWDNYRYQQKWNLVYLIHKFNNSNYLYMFRKAYTSTL